MDMNVQYWRGDGFKYGVDDCILVREDRVIGGRDEEVGIEGVNSCNCKFKIDSMLKLKELIKQEYEISTGE